MYCVLCFHVVQGSLTEEHEAVTVLDGNASCEDHFGYLQGVPNFTVALMNYRRDHGGES